MTYYEKFNSMKEAYVFSFSFLRDCSSGARTSRRSSKLMEKALPDTRDVKLWAQGIPFSWFTDPPRLPKKITKTRARKPEDLANNEILSNNSGVEGFNNRRTARRKEKNMYTNLYNVRTRLKVSQSKLSELSRVSQSQISKIEKGLTPSSPAHDKLVRISEALEIALLMNYATKVQIDTQPLFSSLTNTGAAVFIPLFNERQPMSQQFDKVRALLYAN